MKHRMTVAATAAALSVVVCLPFDSASAQDQGAAAAAPAAAPAAASAPAAPPAQDAEQAGQLQEVVVTAERRATDVQTTPIVVTATSGEQLAELHVNNVSDLQQLVPSFQVMDESGYFNDMNIRGMGQTTNQPIVNPGVAMFRDGIYMAEPISQSEPMFDIHDTEVLEGPQGTFIGGSATAGAVLITSNDPNFRGFSGYIDSQLGNYSDSKIDGAVNLPVDDKFAVRLAFNEEQRHSFSRDLGAMQTDGPSNSIIDPGHEDDREARLSALWKPTDNFQVLGKAEYSYIQTGGEPGEPNPATYTTLFGTSALNGGCTVTGDVLGGCPAGTVQHSAYYYPGEKPYVLDYYGTNMEENELFERFGIEMRYTLPDGIVLRSLSGHVHIDIDHIDNQSYGPQDAGTFYHEIGPNDNYDSEEINIISPTTGKVNWIAGGFWMYRDTPVFVDSYVVPPSGGPLNGYYSAPENPTVLAIPNVGDAVERIMGLFGQVNWQLIDTLQLQVGARENWDNNFNYSDPTPCSAAPLSTVTSATQCGSGIYGINYGAGGQPVNYTFLSPSVAGGHYSDAVPTGKINLSWTPAQGQNFYLFYAQGYKAGGVNANSTDHPYFDPEHIHDWEAGWKGALFNHHMLTQVGLYYIDYDGMQYNIYDTEENGDTSAGEVVENLGASKIKGIEISEQGKFGPVGVNLGFDYNDSQLGSIVAVPDVFLPPNFNTPSAHPQCVAGATYTGASCFNYTPYEVNVGGEETPYGPKITANISVDYTFRIGSESALDPRVTFSHTDHQYASIFETPYTEMGQRNLLDANVDFTHGPWLVQAYGKNLTNQVYVVGDTITDVFYGAPRQLGVRAQYTWQ